MKLPRRTFLRLIAAAAALRVAASTAWAQAYPARPVRVLVPFAPGGQVDVVARLIAQRLSEQLGQQFYVENAAGGGGTIGLKNFAVTYERFGGGCKASTNPRSRGAHGENTGQARPCGDAARRDNRYSLCLG